MMRNRLEEAKAYYQVGLERVASTAEPEGQKFPCGSRVRITKNLGSAMEHFTGAGQLATVQYTHAHAYCSNDAKSYSLDIDGFGVVAWYKEHQLTLVD